jgi:hypothetical protein
MLFQSTLIYNHHHRGNNIITINTMRVHKEFTTMLPPPEIFSKRVIEKARNCQRTIGQLSDEANDSKEDGQKHLKMSKSI